MTNLELKYAHVSRCDTRPAGPTGQALRKHVEEIWDEQERRNAALREIAPGASLRVAPRYACGIIGRLYGVVSRRRLS